MIKILFLINTLGGGGAEKVLVNLVNNMDFSKYDITVETMFDEGVNASFIDKRVHRISKNAPCPRGIAYIFRFFSAKQLYRYFIGNAKYDILVAYMHGAPVKVITGCPDNKVKKIAWLHNGNPETGTFFDFWHKKADAFKAYQQCDAVVGISQSVAKAFSDYTGIRDTLRIVYNTNDVAKIIAKSEESKPYNKESGTVYITSVGRISPEKGYDRLLRICNRLHNEGFKIDVTIVGSGSEEESIKNQVLRLGAEEWFHLAGFQKNPYPYVANADIFVCSSLTEGLSTAVTEAVILGIPCVSTNVSGAKEILGEHNEYGIVTDNNEDALYEGIKAMLSDEATRKHYAAAAKERSAFFDTAATVRQAENLFESLLNN